MVGQAFSLPIRATLGRLAGESACPTKAQVLAGQSGTDAFVCQPGSLRDAFTVS